MGFQRTSDQLHVKKKCYASTALIHVQSLQKTHTDLEKWFSRLVPPSAAAPVSSGNLREMGILGPHLLVLSQQVEGGG